MEAKTADNVFLFADSVDFAIDLCEKIQLENFKNDISEFLRSTNH